MSPGPATPFQNIAAQPFFGGRVECDMFYTGEGRGIYAVIKRFVQGCASGMSMLFPALMIRIPGPFRRNRDEEDQCVVSGLPVCFDGSRAGVYDTQDLEKALFCDAPFPHVG